MRATVTLLLGLLSAGACTKSSSSSESSTQDSRSPKQRQCDRFATDMARTMTLAGQVMVTALEDDPQGAQADRGRAEMRSKGAEVYADLYGKCLEWPPEVMRCLPPLGPLKEGCDERLAAAMDGATPAATDIPAGPSPAWTATLEHDPRTLAVADDGTVLVVASTQDDAVLGLREGTIVWRMEGRFSRWLLPLPGSEPTWAVARRGEVVAFDPATGRERWVVALPPDGEDEEFSTDVSQVPAAAREGERLLVGDDMARFFVVDPTRCGAPEDRDGCVVPAGRLEGEYLDSDARLLVGPSGRRLLWETGELRAFDAQWSPQMTARAHEHLAQVLVDDDAVLLIVDDEVVELAVDCTSAAAFGPSQWPQPGTLVFEGSDECEQCTAPPAGCRRWRTYVDSVVGEQPARLHDDTVVVHDDEHTLALRAGKTVWKTVTGGGGPLATDGRRIFAFGTGVREDDGPALLELSTTDGHPLWSSPLPFEVGDLYFTDDVHLVLGPRVLVVAFEQTIAAVPLP